MISPFGPGYVFVLPEMPDERLSEGSTMGTFRKSGPDAAAGRTGHTTGTGAAFSRFRTERTPAGIGVRSRREPPVRSASASDASGNGSPGRPRRENLHRCNGRTSAADQGLPFDARRQAQFLRLAAATAGSVHIRTTGKRERSQFSRIFCRLRACLQTGWRCNRHSAGTSPGQPGRAAQAGRKYVLSPELGERIPGLRMRGFEPPRDKTPTRPSTWRVCQFRHMRSFGRCPSASEIRAHRTAAG